MRARVSFIGHEIGGTKRESSQSPAAEGFQEMDAGLFYYFRR